MNLLWLKSRSGSHHHHYLDYYDENETTSKAHHNEVTILAELTDEEILDALNVLEKIKKNQHNAKELSDREVV